jgi:DNA-binding beta-propeller fold protein YncE
MKIKNIVALAAVIVLSPFVVKAAPDYSLIEIFFIDDGGDVGIESSPRLLAFDANADLLYASSHRVVNGVLNGRLLAIEPDSGTLIDGISYNYGQNYGLVVANDGNRVYVSRSARNNGGVPSVRVFDTDPVSPSFWSEIGPINTGGSSFGPDVSAITPDGSRIYVTHRGSFVVHAINTSNNSIVNIPVPAGNRNGSQLFGIAITPDGKRAYAVNRTNQTVVAIDTDPSSGTYNTVVATISTSNGASGSHAGITVSPDGRFAYTIQNTRSEVSVIDIDPSSLTFHSEVAKIPVTGYNHISVTVTPDNLALLVTSTSTHELQVIDVDPSSTTFRTEVGVISFPTGSNPWDVKVITEGSAAGSVYVTLPGSNSIALIGVENPNTPPTAVAGDPQSIRVGQTVSLDGTGSFDDNTAQLDLIYDWSFVSVPAGSAATLLGANTATPSFTAEVKGTYVVSLIVTDEGGLSNVPNPESVVEISSENMAPDPLAIHMNKSVFTESVVFAQGYVTLSSDAWINGNIIAGAATTVGANADVYGTIDSGAATTLGSDVWILEGDVYSGAATTLGANSVVQGGVQSGAATMIGAGAEIYGYNATSSATISATPDATWSVQDPVKFWNTSYSRPEVGDLVDAQDYLYNLADDYHASSPENLKNGVTHNIDVNQSWYPGVYWIDGLLSVSADVTITLESDDTDDVFIINVRDYVSFGALAKVKWSGDAATVIWNVKGTYISTGAEAEIEGLLLANTYIATGAKSTVKGGAYSATSYVFVGAEAQITK